MTRSIRTLRLVVVAVFASVGLMACFQGDGESLADAYLGISTEAVAFIQWTESDGEIAGNITIVRLAGDDLVHTDAETLAVSGLRNDARISIAFTARGSETWTGTITDGVLDLDLPGQVSDGRFIPATFAPASNGEYESALKELEETAEDNAERVRQRERSDKEQAERAVSDRVSESLIFAVSGSLDEPVIGGQWTAWVERYGPATSISERDDVGSATTGEWTLCPNSDVGDIYTGVWGGPATEADGGEGIVHYVSATSCSQADLSDAEAAAMLQLLLPNDAVQSPTGDDVISLWVSERVNEVCGADTEIHTQADGNSVFLVIRPCNNK